MVSKCFRVVIYELLIDFFQSWFGRVGPPGNREEAGGPHAASFPDKGAGRGCLDLHDQPRRGEEAVAQGTARASDQSSGGINTAGSYTAHEFRNRWPFSPSLSRVTSHYVPPQNVRLPHEGGRCGGRLWGCSPHHGLTPPHLPSAPLSLTGSICLCCTEEALGRVKAVGQAPTSHCYHCVRS